MKTNTWLLAGCLLAQLSWAAPDRPNVILIVTDDQGYGDIGAHGHPSIQTPELDKLHAESVRFTDFHTDPSCAPTRAALMSGTYSRRAGVWHTIMGGNHLRAGVPTMAEVFRDSGYNTAMFGKWHIGANYPYRPMDRGFDEWLGNGDGGAGTTDDYFTNDRVNDHYLDNGEWEYREGFSPDVFFGAARDYIEQKGQDKPFFIYLATYVPHGPYVLPDPEMAKMYAPIGGQTAWYMTGISTVDRNIGQLRKVLQERGLAENTILIFMSDNGATTAGVNQYNAGMRGKKGQVYEGGHRVPFFVHWPAGKIQQGQDVSTLNAHIDVLPTLMELCDLKSKRPLDLDGRSFKELLYNPEKKLAARSLCIESQRLKSYPKGEKSVVLNSRWRMVDQKELYDIHADPGQASNVIDQHPEVAEQLGAVFDAYWEYASPNDREPAVSIVGHPTDPETLLTSADWCEKNGAAWNHSHTANGSKRRGSAHIRPYRAGRYRFELCRWPKEVNAPLAGVPVLNKTVDSFGAKGARKGLLYGSATPKFKALPVAQVRLKVGDDVHTAKVSQIDTCGVFELDLDKHKYDIRPELLDKNGNVLAGAYYVYISAVN